MAVRTLRVAVVGAILLGALLLGGALSPHLSIPLLAQATLNVLNPASDLNGKTLVTAEGNRTISGTFTWSVPFLAAPGTVGVPGVGSSADATTGLSIQAGQIVFATSGAQRLLLNGSGLQLTGILFQAVGQGYTSWTTITSTATGTQNDFAPGLVGNTILRMNNASLATLTGFASGYDGQHLLIQAIGPGQVDLSYQDAGSAAANREILFATTGKTSLVTGGIAEAVYDGAATKWRLLFHEQGNWIDYSGTSTIVGWASRTTTTLQYYLHGRTLSILYDLEGTSNATTTTFTEPFTYGVPKATELFSAIDNGGAGAAGIVRNQSSTNVIEMFATAAGAAWTASGTKNTIGMWVGPVQ